MPNKKDLSLKEYGISRMRFRELKYYCLQYAEKKQKLSALLGVSAVQYDGMPKGNTVSDSTAALAAKVAEIGEELKIIEETALEAAPGIHIWLLKNVTEEIPYEYMPVPCGRRQFYLARRKFFYLLSEKK